MLDLERSEIRRYHRSEKPRVGLLRRLTLRVFKLAVAFVVLSFLWVALYGFISVPVTPLMVVRAVENWWDKKPVQIQKNWKPLREISPALWASVIAAEDWNFLDHSGFDFEAIDKALARNRQGGSIRGASTISQQVAKNVFLWPSRTWLRKGLETYFTLLVELLWSKRRILEVYLNVIEMGDGVYGAEAASKQFFGKPAVALGPREASLLAAVLPNPRRYQAQRPSGYVRFRQNLIQRRIPLVQTRLQSSSLATR